jgi:hypothetical protein
MLPSHRDVPVVAIMIVVKGSAKSLPDASDRFVLKLFVEG